MGYKQDADLQFRPFRAGVFQRNTPIKEGGQKTTPFQKGVSDLAYNHLTLWAGIRQPLIQHSPRPGEGTVVLTAGSTTYDIAAYKYRVPAFNGPGLGLARCWLTVRVRGYVSAGTWTPGAKNNANQVLAGTSGNTVSSVVEFDLETEEGPYTDFFILEVQGSSAGATFTLEELTVFLRPVTTEDLGDRSDLYYTDWWQPIDSNVGHIADRPLHVEAVSNIVLGNDTLFRYNGRAVVNFSTIANYGAGGLWGSFGDTQATTGRYILLDESDDDGYKRKWEWLYFPRQGSDRLEIHIEGYNSAWSGTADDVRVFVALMDMDGNVLESLDALLGKASYFGSSTWEWDGALLPVPQGAGAGPFRLGMWARSGEASPDSIRITAVSIFERETD